MPAALLTPVSTRGARGALDPAETRLELKSLQWGKKTALVLNQLICLCVCVCLGEFFLRRCFAGVLCRETDYG